MSLSVWTLLPTRTMICLRADWAGISMRGVEDGIALEIRVGEVLGDDDNIVGVASGASP